MTEEEEHQARVVEILHAGMRDVCAGHSNEDVLHAVAMCLVDALDPRFFADKKLNRRERIETLIAAIKEMMLRMTGEREQ